MRLFRQLLFAVSCLLATAAWAGDHACGAALKAANDAESTSHAVACAVAARSLLIAADVHGTNEIPGFVASIVRDASATRPVRLGIEFIGGMQPALNAYVRSRGTAADRKALFGMGYWANQDGRTSEAMRRLIESVRVLRSEGRQVDIFAMKPSYPGDAAIAKAGGANAFVNQRMASAVRKQVRGAKKGALVIAFMGSEHADGTPATTDKTPSVTRQLKDLHPYLLTFVAAGEAWNCRPADGCGIHAIKQATTPGYTLRVLTPIQNVQRIVLNMPVVTASPPVLTQPLKSN